MAIRKPIVIVAGNHLSELPAGDSLMAHLDPDTTTLPELIQALVDSGLMGAPVVTIPVNTSAPVVSGAVVPGDTATTTNGTWTQSPTGYEYKWQIDPGTGFEDVVGQTANTYTSIPAGEYRSAVRAENSAGWSDWAYSSAFVVAEPAAGMTFDGPVSDAVLLSNSNTTLEYDPAGSDTHAVAWVDAALSGDVYFEVVLVRNGVDNFVIFNGDNSRSIDGSNPALDYDSANAGASLLGWSSFFRANYGMGAPNEDSGAITSFGSQQNTIRFKIALKTTTREFWIKEVGSAFAGDPAAGTDPLFVLNGSDPIFLGGVVAEGATVTLVASDDHIDSPPSGFTAI